MRTPPVSTAAVLIAAVASIAAAAPAGSLALGARPARTHVVAIENISFRPATTRLARGDTVTWRFLDAPIDTQHNVTSSGRQRFRSSGTRLSGSYSVRFTRAGTYLFHCTIHSNMRGRIVVR